MSSIRPKLTFANVTSMIALLVALSGTALALQDNTVKSRHIVDNSVRSVDVRDGTLTSDDIKDGSVTPLELAVGAVIGGLGGNLQDESITADDVASNAIGSSELADSSVGTDELKDGAVTTSKMTPNWAAASMGGSIPGITAAQDVAAITIDIPGSPAGRAHAVLLNGDLMLACNCPTAGDSAVVSWYLVRSANGGGETVVVPATQVTLTTEQQMFAAPISWIDQPPQSNTDVAYEYKLVVVVVPSGAGVSVTARDGRLTGVDLGSS